MKYFFIVITTLFFFSCRTYEGIDITKPSAYINYPNDGDLASDTLIVAAIGSDDIGIDYIELWINQEKTELRDYDSPFEFILDTRSLSNIEEGGIIDLAVKAFDTSENESALSTSVQVFLDNFPPTKVVLNPIIEEDGYLQFKWKKCTDLDFYAYVITVNNSHFTPIDTIKDANYTETNIQYNYQDTEFFGVRVLDNGLKSTISNSVQPISFEFKTIYKVGNGSFYFGENDDIEYIDESYELMVSEVSNLQYKSYLSVAKELNQIDINNIGPWVLDNEGNILYDLENGYIGWNGTNFEIDGTQNPLLPNYPVTHVSYYGAKHFAEFFEFQLPSEIQWEKAAADDGLFEYPWGDDFDDDNNPINEIKSSYANYFENEDIDGLSEPYEPGGENNINSDDAGLAPVRYLEGEIDEFWFFNVCPDECQGFNHMSGNVWEWVSHENGYLDRKMARGGSWRSPKQDLRVWSKKYLEAHSTGDHVGFRCVK